MTLVTSRIFVHLSNDCKVFMFFYSIKLLFVGCEDYMCCSQGRKHRKLRVSTTKDPFACLITS